METAKKLYRSNTDRMLFGVCGGLAEYYGSDPTLVRVIFIVLTLLHGIGLLLYLILAVIIPASPLPAPADNRSEKIGDFAQNIGLQAHQTAEEARSEIRQPGGARNALGMAIVAVGLVMLLERIFPFAFRWIDWQVILSLAIIFFGAYIISRK